MFDSTLDTEHAFGHRDRMTRTYVRRRVSLLAALLVVTGAMSGPVAGAVSTRVEPVAHRTYRVQAGDTLWAIAKASAPGQDPRPIVQAIEDVNDVSASELMPGMTLSLPVG
jgi:hypothetical protein